MSARLAKRSGPEILQFTCGGFQMLLRPPRFVYSDDEAENHYPVVGLLTPQQLAADASRERDAEKRKRITDELLRVLAQARKKIHPENKT